MSLVFSTLQAVDAALATSGSGTVDLGAAFGGADVARVSLAGTNTTSSFGGGAGKSRMVRYLSATPLVNGPALALIGNANRTTSPGSVGFYASDASGNWTELAYASGDTALIPSGTAMLFVQSSAPVGWTKSTALNDRALRVVAGAAGTGGAMGFSGVFGSSKVTGDVALTPAQSPPLKLTDGATNAQLDAGANSPAGFAVVSYDVSNGAAHNHTLSLDLAYVDAIIATKDDL